MNLPQDPAILLSYVNTMLRDKYKNLDELCEDCEINKSELTGKLKNIGYEYSETLNRFK